MTAPDVKVWSATPGRLSEGPRWHLERQELLWVDILGSQMHRGTLGPDGALERIETISVDRHIGAVAPAEGAATSSRPARATCSSMTMARFMNSRSPRPDAPTCG